MMGKHTFVNLAKFGTAHYSKLSAKLSAKMDTCSSWRNKGIEKRLLFKTVSTKLIKLRGQNNNIKKNCVAFDRQKLKKV